MLVCLLFVLFVCQNTEDQQWMINCNAHTHTHIAHLRQEYHNSDFGIFELLV